MSEIPGDLKYTKSHEWARIEDDDLVTIGITDHAQAALGDMVFVETPEIGAELEAEEACAVVESVKAASDIYSPVGGEIIETNADLADSPELVNDQPYGDGWIFQMRVGDPEELEGLMDAEGYEAFCDEEE
jgi:glycine cleavage system H protein